MGSKNRHAKYVGFQLSYGGKFFGGYRRDSIGKRNYSLEAYNNTVNNTLEKNTGKKKGVEKLFVHEKFLA